MRLRNRCKWFFLTLCSLSICGAQAHADVCDARGTVEPCVARALTLLATRLVGEAPDGWTLAQAAQFAEAHLLRPTGSERLSEAALRRYAATYAGLIAGDEHLLEANLSEAGLIGDVPAPASVVDYVLLNGSTVTNVRRRIDALSRAVTDGSLQLTPDTKLVFLDGERRLFATETKEALLDPSPYAQDQAWRAPATLPTDERAMDEMLWAQMRLPDALRRHEVTFVHADKSPGAARAETADCVAAWVRAHHPTPGRALVISNNPTVEYQRRVTEVLLAESGVVGMQVVGMGPGAHREHDASTRLGLLLDALGGTLLRARQQETMGLLMGNLASANAPADAAPTHHVGAESSHAELHPLAKEFLAERREFQLHHLLTEQRHPATWDLSLRAQQDTEAALRALWRVDEDVVAMLDRLKSAPEGILAAADQVTQALQEGRKIFVYGCGSTGRLAKTLEALWRQFFARADKLGLSHKWRAQYPRLHAAVVGEITGGDRALVSSLEGFEDLPLVGAMQLEDLGYAPQDVLFAVSEGGETSSVLGALAAARATQNTVGPRTFFVFNNPPDRLMSLARSRTALQDPGVRQLDLHTGPQALAGSTRMQATTSELLVLGSIFEHALVRTLAPSCDAEARAALGLDAELSLPQRMARFEETLGAVVAAAPQVAALTDAEVQAYAAGHHATYFAGRALPTVFTDVTERSPTFRLAPLDPTGAPDVPDAGPNGGEESAQASAARKSWLHVVADAQGAGQAWQLLLGRAFRGLDVERYGAAFAEQVSDPALAQAATRSLAHAGANEGKRYDFGTQSLGRGSWRVRPEDFVLSVLLGEEDGRGLRRHVALGAQHDHAIRIAGPSDAAETLAEADLYGRTLTLRVPADPLGLHQHLAAKVLLNAHSTAVMCKRGRVVGNTMAYVQPSNLKLIGRATYLVQSHVNEVCEAAGTAGLDYARANSLLFEAIDYRRTQDQASCPSEVSLAVGMGLTRTMGEQAGASWDEVRGALEAAGLERYKAERMPASPVGEKDARGAGRGA